MTDDQHAIPDRVADTNIHDALAAAWKAHAAALIAYRDSSRAARNAYARAYLTVTESAKLTVAHIEAKVTTNPVYQKLLQLQHQREYELRLAAGALECARLQAGLVPSNADRSSE